MKTPVICSKCNTPMKEVHSGKTIYWVCEKCGNVIRPRKKKKEKDVIIPKEKLPLAIRAEFEKRYGVGIPDNFDLDGTIDSSLSLDENLEIVKEKLKAVYSEIAQAIEEKEYSKEEAERYQEEAVKREEEYYRKQFEKRIEDIKKGEIKELSRYYEDYYKHIEAFVKNEKVRGFVIQGVGGIGKSYNLFLKLKEMGVKFVLLKSHVSALSFYRFLYENREGQLIVLDDIVKLISDKDIVAMLLSALDYDNNQIAWLSNSPLTKDLPSEFQFNSKIIILANDIKAEDEFLRALKDRCIYYRLEFTREQLIEMMYILAKARGYDLKVVDYIKELSENNSIQNLSLRLLDKIAPYTVYEDWKRLITQITEIDETESLVLELIKSGKKVRDQVAEFIEKTGLSRATFFRIKAKLVSKSQVIGNVRRDFR